MKAGQFMAAERLIEMGPGAPTHDEPLTVRPLRGSLAFPTHDVPVGELLGWCLKESVPSYAGYESWQATDAPAQALLKAMRQAQEGVDHVSGLALCTAMHVLIGSDPARHTAELRDGGLLTRLRFDGFALAPIMPGLPGGLPTWIAPARWPPPQGAEVRVWIMLGPGTDARAADGEPIADYARIDVLTLLKLTVPGMGGGAGGAVQTARDRAVNLLRVIGSRLPVARVLTDDLPRTVLTDEELAWLLNLLGISADAVCQDLIRYETGGHPRLLRDLLTALEPETGAVRVYAVRLVEVDTVRRGAGLAETMKGRFDELLKDPVAAALFRTAALYYWDQPGRDFGIDELLEDMAVLLSGERRRQDETRSALAERRDLFPDALARLTSEGLFVNVGPGRFTLPFNGLRDLFNDARRAPHRAMAGVHALQDQVLRDPLLNELGFGDQLVGVISHELDNELTRIKTDLASALDLLDAGAERELVQRAFRNAQRVPKLSDRYGECLTPPAEHHVGKLIKDAANQFGVVTMGALLVEPKEIGGPLHVMVNDKMFVLIVMELLRNARNAIPTDRPGRVSIVARAARDLCLVSVEDDGPGFGSGALAGVSGRGLHLVGRVVADFCGGALTVMDDGSGPDGRRGAHIRISLPLLPRTTPATAPAPPP